MINNKIESLINSSTCPFCKVDSEREIIFENDTSFSIYDKFPVNNGHALIIPKRHSENYFELTKNEQIDCLQALNTVKQLVYTKFKPDGFNIGINVGEMAGQTISHVHIHLIPRFSGDVEDPRGGVRGVIPNKQKY
jgi:diadenosine tetraphosphate (Ap4A) HIT family hydrolase